MRELGSAAGVRGGVLVGIAVATALAVVSALPVPWSPVLEPWSPVPVPWISAAVAAEAQPHYAVTDSVRLGGEGGWDCLTVDPSAHRLYLSHSTEVEVVDLDSNKPAGKIEDTPGVHAIALASAAGEGYTSNGRDSSVTVFDPKSLKPIVRIPVGARNPDLILADPFSQRVFTTSPR